MAVRRKLAAILCAEAAAVGKRAGRDDARAEQRRQVRQLVRACAVAHSGRLVKNIGDSALVEFESAASAVHCALEIQRRMRALNLEAAPDDPLQVRIGVHVGDVVEEEDGDLFGDTVTIARRVQDLASPGSVCLTREVYTQIHQSVPLRCNRVVTGWRDPMLRLIQVFKVRRGEERRVAPVVRADPVRMTLARAQRLARVVRPWQQRIGRWPKRLATMGVCSVVFAFVIDPTASHGEGAFFFFTGVASGLTGLGVMLRQALPRRLAGSHAAALDPETLRRCAVVGEVPADVSDPLSRALSAYVGISQAADDPAWEGSELRVREFQRQAREQLLILLERGRQLGRVGGMLQRYGPEQGVPAGHEQVFGLYRHHQAKLAAAAGVFEQAEAGLFRALLALSSKPVGAAARDEPLREMGANFQALAEVLESLEEMPALGALELPDPLPEEPSHRDRLRETG